MDDFHPDRIVERIEPPHRLVTMRRDLDDPSRFKAAAAEIMERAERSHGGLGAAQEPERIKAWAENEPL